MSWLNGLYARIVGAVLWLAGVLPLRAAQALAALVALFTRWSNNREVRVAQTNLRLCFPALDEMQREGLLRECLRHTACTAIETARLWRSPLNAGRRLLHGIEGEALLDTALAAGRGVLIAAPHLGNWELLNQYLASKGPLSIVYRVPQSAALEPMLVRGRGGDQVEQLRAEPSSVRKMLRALRAGRMLGVLPDQRPKIGEGEFAPLFGQPALTMTLLPRLARASGCAVLFGFAERLPDARGFRIHLLPAPADIDAEDPVVAVAALNKGIEACVALAPMQYQWTYKRYSIRPPGGGANPYRQKSAPGSSVA